MTALLKPQPLLDRYNHPQLASSTRFTNCWARYTQLQDSFYLHTTCHNPLLLRHAPCSVGTHGRPCMHTWPSAWLCHASGCVLAIYKYGEQLLWQPKPHAGRSGRRGKLSCKLVLRREITEAAWRAGRAAQCEHAGAVQGATSAGAAQSTDTGICRPDLARHPLRSGRGRPGAALALSAHQLRRPEAFPLLLLVRAGFDAARASTTQAVAMGKS
jgi:hypothetical protein